MSLRPLLLALAPLAAGCATFESRDAPPERIGVDVGTRHYSGSSWEGLDSQTSVGLTVAGENVFTPVGVDFGFHWTEEAGDLGGQRISIDTYELYGGVVKVLPLVEDRLRVEVGAGSALNYYASHAPDAVGDRHENDFFVSFYARTGLHLRLGGSAWLGFDARLVRGGQTTVFGTNLEGDYEQLTVSLSLGE